MAYGPVNLDIFGHDGRLLSMPISTPAYPGTRVALNMTVVDHA